MASIPRDDSPLSKDSWKALFWLLFYSTGMFTLPFGSFYLVRHYMTEYFDFDYFVVTCCSVLAAVLTVNLIIVAYAIQGFREVEKEKIPTTSDVDNLTPEAKKTK